MSIRFSRLAIGILVLAVIAIMAEHSWAIRYGLGPSKNEWGLVYDVEVTPADNDKLNVVFTLSDEGRLKPIYSIDLIAFSRQTDAQGGRSYDVKEPIQLKPTKDGKHVGQVQVRKEFLDRAKIHIITLTLDGKRQPSGGVFYEIPIAKYLNRGTVAASPRGSSPAPRSAAAPPSSATK